MDPRDLRRHNQAKPKKLLTSVTFRGGFQLTIASIFAGLTLIPSTNTIWPRNDTSLSQKSHLLNFANNSFSLRIYNTILKCCSCSCASLEYIKMSSMNTTTNWSKKGWNTLFIKFMNAAGALLKTHNDHIGF